jgi:hypothetical protein
VVRRNVNLAILISFLPSKVRNYLWSQPHIARYNEDGKKSKSKGNHIWIVDARRIPDGGWVFRPFHRRLTGSPPGVAYMGLPWSWKPRVWFPQGGPENRGHNRTRIPVKFSSPEGSLPSWLSWKGDTLTGTPPAFGADSCDVTVEALVRRRRPCPSFSEPFFL